MLHTWIDGIPADAVPVDDRGLNYADGVFETLLCRQGRILGAQLHEARLARGLSVWLFPMQIVWRKPFSQRASITLGVGHSGVARLTVTGALAKGATHPIWMRHHAAFLSRKTIA